MAHLPIKLFSCDLNFVRYSSKEGDLLYPSTAHDWAFIDPEEYLAYHLDFGSNAVSCQAYTFGGYAFYPTRLGPVAPGPGQQFLPRLYDLARKAGVSFWSYFNVGTDLIINSHRTRWTIPDTAGIERGYFLAPESPWTDLLCARVQEFLQAYPVDWLLLDWFVYGSLRPDKFTIIQPAWFMKEPFREICGRDLPDDVTKISPEENLHYKRTVLTRQFVRLRDTVRVTSPTTRIIFNVPYWEAAEPLWVDHPMLNESDGLFAECSRTDVMEWLLSIRKPGQRVMTTIIGRCEKGECDPNTWRTWYERGCDFCGYAWGQPPDFRPVPAYDADLAITRAAFHAMA